MENPVVLYREDPGRTEPRRGRDGHDRRGKRRRHPRGTRRAFLGTLRERPHTLFLLGPGSTLSSIATAIGIDKTLLGVDAVVGGQAIAKNLNERGILDLLDRYPEAKLVVSPVCAQGFILGRGNLEVSTEVL